MFKDIQNDSELREALEKHVFDNYSRYAQLDKLWREEEENETDKKTASTKDIVNQYIGYIKNICGETNIYKYLPDFIEDDGNRESLEIIKKWIPKYYEGRKWVTITGQFGSGKTMLKNIIIAEIFKQTGRQRSIVSEKLSRLYAQNLQTFQDGTNYAFFEKITTCDLLVIDEIGRRKVTDSLKDFMFDVLDERYDNRKPVVLISNLSTKKIEGRESLLDHINPSRFSEVGLNCPIRSKDRRPEAK